MTGIRNFGLNFTDALKEKVKGIKTPSRDWADEDKKLLAAAMLGNRNNALIDDPSKYFGDAETYSRFIGGVPSHKRTAHTDQQAINEYLLGRDANRMDFSGLLDALKESKGDGFGGAPFGYFDYDDYYADPGPFQFLLEERGY
jgi:hypothetical protein